MGWKYKWIFFLFGLMGSDISADNLLPQRRFTDFMKTDKFPVNLIQNKNFNTKSGNEHFLNLLQYTNITVADTNTVCEYFRTAPNVSEQCAQQLEIVCENSTLLMTMLDASSKFPYPGLTYSSRMDFGNFDQCLTIDHHYSGGRILGEYCTVGWGIPDVFDNSIDLTDPASLMDSAYKLSLCRPDACTADDYNAIVENLTSLSVLTNSSLTLFSDYNCITAETNATLDNGDIAVLSIFGIFISLMTLSTLYDICLYFSDSKSQHPLLLSFSVLSNGRKLLHISKHPKSKEQIEVFHGIRVISMMWIVAGHGIVMWQYIQMQNVGIISTWQQEMYSVYIVAAPLAVDTFFFMSGFLLAFQYFKGKTKSLQQQVTAVPHMYVHRILRLTPAMLMIYLLMITFYVHLGSGPVWNIMTDLYSSPCKKHWLRFFLYIQNYADTSDICLVQTWYLSADMQLFILSPIVLIPVSLHLKKYGFKFVMIEFLIFNIFWTFLPMVMKLLIRDQDFYYDTQSRAINYCIGMMLGLFMRVKIEQPFLYMIKQNNRSAANLIIWPIIILGMLATVICYQDQNFTSHYGYNSKTVFSALMRPAWCIGLSWITYSCYHGQGGFVNWILCRPIFQVLGRLTYCIYLTHMTVVGYYISAMRFKWYFSDYVAFYQFCGNYIMSVTLATFWTLAFESPLMILEKYFLGGGGKSRERTLPQNEKAEGQTKAEP